MFANLIYGKQHKSSWEMRQTSKGAEGRIAFVLCRAVAGGATRELGSVQIRVTYSQVPPVLELTLQADTMRRHGKKGVTLPRNGEVRPGGMAAAQTGTECRLSLHWLQETSKLPSKPNSSAFCATSCKYGFQTSCSTSPEAFASRMSVHQATLSSQWGLCPTTSLPSGFKSVWSVMAVPFLIHAVCFCNQSSKP